MKFQILTDRMPKFEKGEVIETSDNPLDPKHKLMLTLVGQKEAKLASAPKTKMVIKNKVKKVKKK